MSRQIEESSNKWMHTDQKFCKKLDNLLEGIQVIDYNWRISYANKTLVEYEHTTKEETDWKFNN